MRFASASCLLYIAVLVLQTEAMLTITSIHRQKYKPGDTATITWTSTTDYDDLYSITVYDSGRYLKSSGARSPFYSYIIPSDVVSDLIVTIQGHYDFSTAVLTLEIEGSLTLYAPSPNAIISSTALIKWDARAYNFWATITLKCYSASNSALIQTITTSTPVSAKQYSWTAPSSIGMYYLVGSFNFSSATYSDTTTNFAVNSPNGDVTSISLSVAQVTYSDSDRISVAWSFNGLPSTAPVTFYIVNQQTNKVYQCSPTQYVVGAQSGYMSMPSTYFPKGQYKVRIQAAGVNRTSNLSFSSSGSSPSPVTLSTAAIAGISAGSFVVFIIIVAGVRACLRNDASAAACCCCSGAITSGSTQAKTKEIAVSYNKAPTTGSPQMCSTAQPQVLLAMTPQSGPVSYPQTPFQPSYTSVQTTYMSAPQHFSPTHAPGETNDDYAAYVQHGDRPGTASTSNPTATMPFNGYVVAGPTMTQTMHQPPMYRTADTSQMAYMQQQPDYAMYQQVPYGVQQVAVGYATAAPPSYETAEEFA